MILRLVALTLRSIWSFIRRYWWEIITKPMAFIALLVSLITAYFTIAPTTDRLRVTLLTTPRAALNETEWYVDFSPIQNFVLTNEGNRPAAIARSLLTATLFRAYPRKDEPCWTHQNVVFNHELESERKVLAPGDVEIVETSEWAEPAVRTNLEGLVQMGTTFYIQTCIGFDVLSPSLESGIDTRYMGASTDEFVYENGRYRSKTLRELDENTKLLIDSQSTIFSSH